jgi:EAL domain-containing protein (putative c-di-GMP-specific phosphodiesterase class I)/FixJ family two-component response regulator
MNSRRLLILDDEDAVAQTISAIASGIGYDVQVCIDPNEFFARLGQWQPSHLAVDLVMPAMDGVEVLRRLAAMGCHARIIVTSGMGTRVLESARNTAIERGLNISGILPKPFRSQALRELLSDAQATPLAAAVSESNVSQITEPELARAVENGEFVMHFQPKVRMSDRRTVGFEALVRWQHPMRGLLPPGEFLPLAEKSACFVQLSYHFFGIAMGWFAGVCRQFPVSMAVNLSALCLNTLDLADTLSQICERHGVDPQRVILELTETSTMTKPTEATDTITRLRIKGFQLSIDDFGTAYSSMALLTRLPFSELKIDRAFVQTLTLSGDSRKIVDSTIKLARSLQLTTVAEGIEDDKTLAVVSELGCDVAQGFYFARPMDGEKATRWLHESFAERLQIAERLEAALRSDQLALDFMPLVDLGTGCVAGFGVLGCWQHETLGRLSDNRFLDVAREQGLLTDYFRWLLNTACNHLTKWRQQGDPALKIILRLNEHMINEPMLLDLLSDALEQSGLNTDALGLDIPDTVVANANSQMLSAINGLRSVGVQLGITLTSASLSYLGKLKRIALHSLGMSPSFTRELTQDPDDPAALIALASMAHGFGATLVATGVQTEAQCKMLSQHFCDLIQGSLLSEPIPAEDVSAFLNQDKRLAPELLRSGREPPAVLLVDDEERIISSLRRLLRRQPYRLLTARSGVEGLDTLARENVDVVVSDQRMPGMTGIEFLQQVAENYPDTIRLVLSGYTDLESVIRAVNTGSIYKFLTKPWEDAQLMDAITDAVSHKTMADENRRLSQELMSANLRLEKANQQLKQLLQQQQQSLHNREVGLRVAYEGLEHVPIPMLGLDDEKIVVFINRKARERFEQRGLLLASELDLVLPEVVPILQWSDQDEKAEVTLPEDTFTVIKHCMRFDNRVHGFMLFLLSGIGL